ncbi:hypothetical protein [Rhodococcus sp. D-46]|uniref:hypothetical protein n=1 Tax=Rhodococcus sp. D-46 TaxID=2716265 RepID=UPI001A998F74
MMGLLNVYLRQTFNLDGSALVGAGAAIVFAIFGTWLFAEIMGRSGPGTAGPREVACR